MENRVLSDQHVRTPGERVSNGNNMLSAGQRRTGEHAVMKARGRRREWKEEKESMVNQTDTEGKCFLCVQVAVVCFEFSGEILP